MVRGGGGGGVGVGVAVVVGVGVGCPQYKIHTLENKSLQQTVRK